MKRTLLFIFIFSFLGLMINAQEEVAKKKDKPVRSPYETTILIDFPTTLNPAAGSFQLLINHRFGVVKSISDLYGIYAPSNIRMSGEYGITKNISIGFSTEKNNKMQVLHWKWTFLNQTRSGAIPVSIAYYGALGMDARDKEVFGINYNTLSRLSFFNELIISRKFSPKLTAQVGASFSHFNMVKREAKHDHIGFHLGGRYKVWNSNSIIFEYSLPYAINRTAENPPKQGLSLGMEFGSSTHGFQVFASNYDKLNPQMNVGQNIVNDFFAGDILLGFNITVRF